MFVRRKTNKSGKVSVQVIDKSQGKYQVVKTLGSSSDLQEIDLLEQKGEQWIQERIGQRELGLDGNHDSFSRFLSHIQEINVSGTELLLGRLFTEIGFDLVADELFRQLVLARLCFPVSKLKTTLYFEIDHEDDIRKTGFSKEGKHQNPQIVLGLLVSINGYPLAYEIFEGNKFEGHTMLPVIDAFKAEYQLDRLVINYSSKRAKKDKHNRERGLRRLEKKLKGSKLTKSNINNKGYNKYLKLQGDVDISIDRDKFEEDAKWDGMKGYLTNTDLRSEEIIENYNQLWKIEKAFRVSKSDLKIRPIYHRLERRIEAHICISFAAYKIYKELERQLEVKEAGISPEKAIEIARTIYSIKVKIPGTGEIIEKKLLLDEEQKFLAELFGF